MLHIGYSSPSVIVLVYNFTFLYNKCWFHPVTYRGRHDCFRYQKHPSSYYYCCCCYNPAVIVWVYCIPVLYRKQLHPSGFRKHYKHILGCTLVNLCFHWARVVGSTYWEDSCFVSGSYNRIHVSWHLIILLRKASPWCLTLCRQCLDVATLLSLSKSISRRGTQCAQIRFMWKCSWRIFHLVPKGILVPSTTCTSLIVRQWSSLMNLLTDATNIGIITDGLPERASSLMFDLPFLKHLNHLKTVAASYLWCAVSPLHSIKHFCVWIYSKWKQNFTAACDSPFSRRTIMDVVCEQCMPLKCTLHALYISQDEHEKNSWQHINSRQYFMEIRRKKTRVKVVPDDTYIASKLGVLWGNMGGDKYWYW